MLTLDPSLPYTLRWALTWIPHAEITGRLHAHRGSELQSSCLRRKLFTPCVPKAQHLHLIQEISVMPWGTLKKKKRTTSSHLHFRKIILLQNMDYGVRQEARGCWEMPLWQFKQKHDAAWAKTYNWDWRAKQTDLSQLDSIRKENASLSKILFLS